MNTGGASSRTGASSAIATAAGESTTAMHCRVPAALVGQREQSGTLKSDRDAQKGPEVVV
jgi:hypothetical protein